MSSAAAAPVTPPWEMDRQAFALAFNDRAPWAKVMRITETEPGEWHRQALVVMANLTVGDTIPWPDADRNATAEVVGGKKSLSVRVPGGKIRRIGFHTHLFERIARDLQGELDTMVHHEWAVGGHIVLSERHRTLRRYTRRDPVFTHWPVVLAALVGGQSVPYGVLSHYRKALDHPTGRRDLGLFESETDEPGKVRVSHVVRFTETAGDPAERIIVYDGALGMIGGLSEDRVRSAVVGYASVVDGRWAMTEWTPKYAHLSTPAIHITIRPQGLVVL